MKRTLSFLFLVQFGLACFCQSSLKNVWFFEHHSYTPSPEAASLIKYADIPVSLYTGVPEISIPIEDIKVGNYSLPVSVSYHASGIKLDQEASQVGLGWCLNAGGMISRVINAGDDLGMYTKRGDKVYIEFADNEPDFFYYNFGNYAGRFYLKKDTYHEVYTNFILANPEDNLKIEGNDRKFKITAPDNTVYIFGTTEEKQYYYVAGNRAGTYIDNGTDFSSTFGSIERVDLNSGISDFWFRDSKILITGWYLSQIQLPTGETIDFRYTRSDESFISPMRIEDTEVKVLYYKQLPGFKFMTNLDHIRSYGGYPQDMEKRTIEKMHSLPILRKIEWADGYLDFIPSKAPREDIRYRYEDSAPHALEYINLCSKQKEILKSYKFSYSYFHGDDRCQQYKEGYDERFTFLLDRLKLDSITVLGKGDPCYTYKMEYDMTTPMHCKSCLGGDKWNYFASGECFWQTQLEPFVADSNYYEMYWNPDKSYYKRDGTNQYIKIYDVNYNKPILRKGEVRSCPTGGLPQKYPSSDMSKAWMLTRLVSPTNGTTDFKYECNEIRNGEVDVTENGNITATYHYALDYHDESLYYVSKFSIPFDRGYMELTYQYDNEGRWREGDVNIITISGAVNFIQTDFPYGLKNTGSATHEQYTFTKYIPIDKAGECKILLKRGERDSAIVKMTLKLYDGGKYTYKADKVGGLRIAEIRNGETIRRFHYTSLDNNPSGVLTYKPIFSRLEMLEIIGGFSGNVVGQVAYIKYSSTPFTSLYNPFTNNYMGYSNVIEEKISGTSLSKEYFDFHNV